jgi:hypothetical protein
VVDGEVVDGEPTWNCGARRGGYDQIGVAAGDELGTEFSRAVGRIGQHCDRQMPVLE